MTYGIPELLRGAPTTDTGACSKVQRAKQQQYGFKEDGKTAEGTAELRETLTHLLYDSRTECFMGIVIVSNFFLIIVDADTQAEGKESHTWVTVLGLVCLVFYVIELSTRFFVERMRILDTSWNYLDITVVFFGVFGEIIEATGTDFVSLDMLRVLRCLRLLRVLRAVKLIIAVKELVKLIRVIAGCGMTLLWAGCLLFVFMTMWSTVAVEIVHPLLQNLIAEGLEFEGCERCPRSFETVMNANLTFFQTIVAGDRWGLVAIPIIDAHPWTVFIFAGVLFTLLFGMLNLIVAVLVDITAEKRVEDEDDIQRQHDDMEMKQKHDLEQSMRQCRRMEMTGNDIISFADLQKDIRRIPELRDRMERLHMSEAELQDFYQSLDVEGQDDVDVQKFIDGLYPMASADRKMEMTFVKLNIMNIKRKQDALTGQVGDILKTVGSLSKPVVDQLEQSDNINRHVAKLSKQISSFLGTENMTMSSPHVGPAGNGSCRRGNSRSKSPPALSLPGLLGDEEDRQAFRREIREQQRQLSEDVMKSLGRIQSSVHKASVAKRAPQRRPRLRVFCQCPEAEQKVCEADSRPNRDCGVGSYKDKAPRARSSSPKVPVSPELRRRLGRNSQKLGLGCLPDDPEASGRKGFARPHSIVRFHSLEDLSPRRKDGHYDPEVTGPKNKELLQWEFEGWGRQLTY